MPDPSSISFSGPSRSNSLASTASGASLTRRSRITRKRTKTITAGPHGDEKKTELVDQVLDISASNNAPLASGLVISPPETPIDALPTHPGLRQDASSSTGIPSGSEADRSCDTFGTFGPLIHGHGAAVSVHPSESHPVVAPSSVTVTSSPASKGKGRHPPRLTSLPPSFKPAPAELDRARSSLRDSLSTQQSSTSSSVYPMSTATDTESPPSPQSPVLTERGVPVPTFELDGLKVQEFDADDVSYRLQLLVKNNYFLPPAHSKPSPADFPSPVTNSKKSPAPTFLDLFRVGKPKSKPASPDSANPTSPILRVTSDSTTASGQVARDQGKPSPQMFRPPPGSQHMARVVVVREMMGDLAAAARQAEVDLGRRDFLLDRERASRRSNFAVFDGIVDPTETVDLPPPSANYPLALQASALHRLGIEDSVGAAVLAERLPPPGSPGQSSLDPREDAWRRALLREAVGHSLNDSRATSIASRRSSPTKSPLRPRSCESLHPEQVMKQRRRMLDQKILSHPIIDPSDDFDPSTATALNPSASVAVVADSELRRLSNLALSRAETPVPHNPLPPPPRRPFCNPQFSQSQTNISSATQDAVGQLPRKTLRKSISSPMLSEKHGYQTIGNITKSPPMPSLSISPPASSIHPFDHRMSRMTAMSRYTNSEQEDVVDDQLGRHSLASTLPSTDGRLSLSEYSQPSPTASAFRDRWSDGYYSANSGNPAEESANASADFPVPRRPSTMSPPPRRSSSIAGIALSPPPRHLPYQPTSSRIPIISPSRSSSQSTAHSFAAPYSTLPPSTHPPLPDFLNVSSQTFQSTFHTAPPPSSTTEFFDHIQAHAYAMDDLYDSDGSATETDQDTTADFAPSSCRPSLMRLGNLSTPNILPGAREPYYPSATPDERKPVGHTAAKTPYFSALKGAPESLSYLSLSQFSRDHVSSEESLRDCRPSTAGAENVRRWQQDQHAFQESSRRLDGLLIRHMQAEKDTLKRIAQTAQEAKS